MSVSLEAYYEYLLSLSTGEKSIKQERNIRDRSVATKIKPKVFTKKRKLNAKK